MANEVPLFRHKPVGEDGYQVVMGDHELAIYYLEHEGNPIGTAIKAQGVADFLNACHAGVAHRDTEGSRTTALSLKITLTLAEERSA